MVITSLTRNQVVRKGTWVRIPPAPPSKPYGFDTIPKGTKAQHCWAFSIFKGQNCHGFRGGFAPLFLLISIDFTFEVIYNLVNHNLAY